MTITKQLYAKSKSPIKGCVGGIDKIGWNHMQRAFLTSVAILRDLLLVFFKLEFGLAAVVDNQIKNWK